MECQGLHPDEPEYEPYKRSTEKCLLHYSKLAKIAISQNILQWNTVHKHRLAWHMPEQFRHLNCRFVSTYSGETVVGFMASLGHACLNGTPPHLVLQRLPGDIDWDCIWAWHMVTLTWWIPKKTCESCKRAVSLLATCLRKTCSFSSESYILNQQDPVEKTIRALLVFQQGFKQMHLSISTAFCVSVETRLHCWNMLYYLLNLFKKAYSRCQLNLVCRWDIFGAPHLGWLTLAGTWLQ